jgi:hypothetical protein
MKTDTWVIVGISAAAIVLSILALNAANTTNDQLTQLNSNVSVFSNPVNSIENWFDSLFGSNQGNS